MAEPMFFFDTADVDYIKRVWERLEPTTFPRAVVGITTNPNAFDKINCRTLEEMEIVVYRLARFLTSIRPEGYSSEIHIQLPVSTATADEHRAWARYIGGLGDGKTSIVMKMPPYAHVLQRTKAMVEHMHPTIGVGGAVSINITGIADAATAHLCLSHSHVKYVSIIPGRMTEMGINSVAHLRSLQQRVKMPDLFTGSPNQFVIAGSMRTVEGLKESIIARTIPTIGTRVWDAMTDADYADFSSWWNIEPAMPNYLNDIPFTDDRNVSLTESFFNQMDKLGAPMMEEFRSTIMKV